MIAYTGLPAADVEDAAEHACVLCPDSPTGHGTGYGAAVWRASDPQPDGWPWLTGREEATP